VDLLSSQTVEDKQLSGQCIRWSY